MSDQWHGWIFVTTASRWRRVCTGDNLSQCHRRLTREAKRWAVPDRLCCMTQGGPPAHTPGSILA